MADAFNPSAGEAERGESHEFEASLVYGVPGQPGKINIFIKRLSHIPSIMYMAIMLTVEAGWLSFL